MLVKVFKLEDEENALTTFSNGCHIIGRGTDLQCNDKRVSRNHATLEVNKNYIRLTSTHINPCYIKMEGSKTTTLLPKDSSKELTDGDAFAFLPDEFWFKIKIVDENFPVTQETEERQGVKRELNNSEGETEDKKRKLEEPVKEEKKEDNDKEEVSSSSTNAGNSPYNEQASSNNTDVRKQEKKDDKQEDREDLVGALTSTTPPAQPKRDRCWYGAGCYRKNPGHRSEFTHPGDSDYESDPDDKRPSCSYGAACYRTNKDHRRNYKHPTGGPPSKEKKKRTRKKVDRLNVGDYHDSDLSDLSEDPFEVYSDSDEYVQDSDNDDSDWDDSQDMDEDSENVKRLVKEAKRFTRK